MPPPRGRTSRRQLLLHRVLAWAAGWIFAGALYLVLIDTADLPELLVGAGAATLAASGFELAREQHVLEARVRLGWLRRAYRPFANVPRDIFLVSVSALRQLVRPSRARGEFRAVAFRGDDEEHGAGRRAVAESLGSLAPNTIVVGVDPESGMILGHQLKRNGGREAIDPVELG